MECLEEGGDSAECPILQGCHVEGRTCAEAVERLEDAIRAFVASYRELGKQLPAVARIHGRTVATGGIPVPVRDLPQLMGEPFPAVTDRDLVRLLKSLGFEFFRSAKGSREIRRRLSDGRHTSVPLYAGKVLKRRTLKSILQDAGPSVAEFRASLRGEI